MNKMKLFNANTPIENITFYWVTVIFNIKIIEKKLKILHIIFNYVFFYQ